MTGTVLGWNSATVLHLSSVFIGERFMGGKSGREIRSSNLPTWITKSFRSKTFVCRVRKYSGNF